MRKWIPVTFEKWDHHSNLLQGLTAKAINDLHNNQRKIFSFPDMLSQGLLLLNSILFPKCYQCRTILFCIWKRTLLSKSAVLWKLNICALWIIINQGNKLQQIGSKQRVKFWSPWHLETTINLNLPNLCTVHCEGEIKPVSSLGVGALGNRVQRKELRCC